MSYQNQARILGVVFALLSCLGSVGGAVALLEIAAADNAPASALRA